MTVNGLSMVRVKGFSELVAEIPEEVVHSQYESRYPLSEFESGLLGVAENVTSVPVRKVPPPLTVPPPSVVVVITFSCGMKLGF